MSVKSPSQRQIDGCQKQSGSLEAKGVTGSPEVPFTPIFLLFQKMESATPGEVPGVQVCRQGDQLKGERTIQARKLSDLE